MDGAKGRVWFGLTAFAVLFGLIVQVLVAANATQGAFDTTAGRVFNVFCFFTIQSNLIVGATSLLLALNPRRSSTVFNTFRLTGIVAITITGIVYHSVLSGLFDLGRWALVADNVLHTIVPILAVVGWIVWGPRGLTPPRIMRLSVIFPICWLIFVLIRGPIVDYYPYHFINVTDLGYARVLVNCVWVAVLYLGVAASATALDGWLARIRSALATAEDADRPR